jgi:hypothetical protein
MTNALSPITDTTMVPADKVVYSTVEAFAVARRTKEQKAAGVKVATAKAIGFAQQGAMPALLAATGVNRNANLALVRAQGIGACVGGNQVRYAVAMRQVLAAAELPESFALDVLASGEQVAKRADWLKLGARLETIVSDPASKKAQAKRASVALKLHRDIQATADAQRVAMGLDTPKADTPAPTDTAPTDTTSDTGATE